MRKSSLLFGSFSLTILLSVSTSFGQTVAFDKVGIGVVDPVALLDIQGSTATNGVVGRIRTTQPEFGDWNFNYFPFDVNGELRQDHVVNFGWNVAAGGGPLVPGLGTFYEQFESHYRPGGPDDPREWFEWHLNFFPYTGQSTRPISISTDKVTRNTVIALQGTLVGQSVDSSVNYLQVNETGLMFRTNGTTFRGLNNQLIADINPSLVSLRRPVVVSNGLTITKPDSTQSFHFLDTGRLVLGDSDSSYPSIEQGFDAPTAHRPDGSIYMRRTCCVYTRTGGAWVRVGNVIDRTIASTTYDPPSLNNGASAVKQVVADPCTPGDPVTVGFSGFSFASGGAAGWQLSAICIGNADVRVTFTNLSGTTRNLPAGILKVIVARN